MGLLEYVMLAYCSVEAHEMITAHKCWWICHMSAAVCVFLVWQQVFSQKIRKHKADHIRLR